MDPELWLLVAAAVVIVATLVTSRRVRTITKACIADPKHQCEVDRTTSEVTQTSVR
jgi:hypothetical protein